MYDTYFFHFGTIALVVALNSISVGIGEGLVSLAALKAISIQPSANDEIQRIFILGMALVETSAIIGLTVAIFMLRPIDPTLSNFSYMPYAEMGIASAICISGMVIGIASSFPAQYACLSVARQPFSSQKIQVLMLLTQSLMQTPIIFAFIVTLFIKSQMEVVVTYSGSLALLASGLCIGLGSIGPSIGLAFFSKEVCKSIGKNRHAYPELLSFTLISEAIIESPLIFALIVSLMLLGKANSAPDSFLTGIGFLAGGLCMGLATFGPGVSSGRVAAQACKEIALAPETYGSLSKTSLLAQVLIETCAIYGLIVSLLLILIQ